MIKSKLLFTALLFGSAFFTIFTSFSNLHEDFYHLIPPLGLYSVFILYLWRDKLGTPSLEAQKGLFTGLVCLSLFLFISTHVIPSPMLLDRHHGHSQSTEHKSHPCCIPVLPPAPITGVDEVTGFIQEIVPESEIIHTAAPIFSDHNRSPPVFI